MVIRDLRVELVPVAELVPYARNARLHSAAQVAAIARSIEVFGWTNPVLLGEGFALLAGHGRVLAARRLGLAEVPAVRLEWLSALSAAQVRAYVIADNRLAELASWDPELLALELGAVAAEGLGLAALGFSPEAAGALLRPAGGGEVSGPFPVAPVSVLNAREGAWRLRRAAWLALGLRSELGRATAGRESA